MAIHVFKVEMSCEGCAKAISNVLNKHKGEKITDFVVDFKTATVEINSSLTVQELTEILQKTGKTVSYLEEKK